MDKKTVFEQFKVLSEIEKIASEQAQKIRLQYQDENNLSGNDFFRLFGDYLKETTGKYHI